MECTYCNKRIEASPLCLPCMNDGDLPAANAVEGGRQFGHCVSAQQEYVQIESLSIDCILFFRSLEKYVR